MYFLTENVQFFPSLEIIIWALESKVINIRSLISEEANENLSFIQNSNMIVFKAHTERAFRLITNVRLNSKSIMKNISSVREDLPF